MTTQLSEAMTAGVFVEFHDEKGNTLGQAVYLEWQGRPLPAVGDTVTCQVNTAFGPWGRSLSGRVESRHFDIQEQENGQPCVWARIVARAHENAKTETREVRERFSVN